MKTSTALLAFILALMVGRSAPVCAPDCSNVESGFSVRDPTDCTRYYACIQVSGELVPSTYPIDCPSGQYFNDNHPVPRCDPIEGAPNGFCSNLCNPCLPHCTADGQLTPNPTDCSTYYICLQDGHVIEVGCTVDMPFYDFSTGYCSNDDSLCYDYCDTCEPHCTEAGTLIPNPQNCHEFYECNPPVEAIFLCPHDQVFNRETEQCEDDAVCQVDCPGTDNPLF